MGKTTEPVRMYFAFRSPYSWMATELIAQDGIAIDPVAFIKPPAGTPPPNPITSPAKGTYVARDVVRLAKRLGFEFALPNPFDIDFSRPNNVFQLAKEEDRALAFMLAAYRARFVGGRNISEDDVLCDIAVEAGLDPDATLVAADSVDLRARSLLDLEKTLEIDQPFGVPFFVYQGEPFWGQDRIDLLIEAVRSAEI
ncbi:DSBA-like thioredoxin domain protein [Rhodobiaceae bacterium]|nr:DSBA-like thioredoxin domain protein [Rhodobiaceae bacterium]